MRAHSYERDGIGPLPVAVAVGDPGREGRLIAELEAGDEYRLGDVPLTAGQLLETARSGRVGAALVGEGLLGLKRSSLTALEATGIAIVLFSAQPEKWRDLEHAVVVPADSEWRAVIDSLRSAAARQRVPLPRPEREPSSSDGHQPLNGKVTPTPGGGELVVVTSGPGAPGRTTLAAALAAALGSSQPTALVDCDLAAPSVGACLIGSVHLETDRNIHYLLAHVRPHTPAHWDDALSREMQPMGWWAPYGTVLCGIPRPSVREEIGSKQLVELSRHLRRRHRYVVVDLGGDPHMSAVYRQAVALADRVLFVAGTGFVALSRARTGLQALRADLGLPTDRVALVLNGYDRRHDARLVEIEDALGLAPAAVLPWEPAYARRSVELGLPLSCMRRSAAGRAIRRLAARVEPPSLHMPSKPGDRPKRWLRIGRGGR
jgi:MinD-like ATPase involved in chromosome partitioning or flagellar assembly